MFGSYGGGYSKRWKTSNFVKLDPDVKMLMAVGLVNTPSFSCFKTQEERLNWVLKMVNKGKSEEEDQLMSSDGLGQLIEECIEKGYISQNGHGPQITQNGIDYIKTFNKRQKTH